MKNTSKHFVGFWHYGIILTYLSVISAVVGICLSCSGYPFGGIICLWISGICDAFDGAVAKTRKNREEADRLFGQRIDSLSDLVAFGVAPVMIGFGMGMHEWYYLALFCVFVLCALIRLAYFDATEEIRTRDENCGRRLSYEGLPVTNIAVGLPIFYLVATMFQGDLAFVQPYVMAFCYLLGAFLYVFRFKMPKLRVKGISITIAVVVVICVSLMLVKYFVIGV